MSEVHALGLRPGDIGFARIGGSLGWWIALCQALTGDANRFTHVFVVLDNDEVAEAMPSGARIQPLDRQYSSEVAYVKMNLTDQQRINMVKHLRQRLARPGGIKYSFVDYLALALANFGIKPKWLGEYIARSDRQICSQLADYELAHGALEDISDPDSGYHVFCDGRLPQDVKPGGLFFELLELQGNIVVIVDPTREGYFSPEVSE